MKHCGTKTIETDRLILRQFKMTDADVMYNNWASDEEVTKFLIWPAHGNIDTSKSVLAEWTDLYSKDDYYHWAIVPKDNGDSPVGSIGVVQKNDEISMMHIGYCIGKKWWNKGITSEALKAVIDYLFKEVGVNRIESRHDPRNPNSGRVMKSCGMKYEGTQRCADHNNQGICDASYYAVLKSDH